MSIFSDISDADFVDVLPARPAGPAPLVISVKLFGRKNRQSPRLQLNMSSDLESEIGGGRFAIQFAAAKGLLRVKADDRGAYEAVPSGRGDRRLIRCPLPPGVFAGSEPAEPEFYVDAIGRQILVEMPQAFLRSAPVQATPKPLAPAELPRLPRPAVRRPAETVTAELMGDPPPERSALAGRGEEDTHMRALLGLTPTFPRRIGGQSFAPAEAAILEVLLRREQVNRYGLLVATHDPAKGEDERDEKIIDVFISRMRARVQALGFDILNRRGGEFYLSGDAKARLKQLISEQEAPE